MKSANKLNAKSVTVMAGGIAVILATFSLGGYYVVEASKRPVDPTASARTENGREVPAGFQLYETNGVSIFLPRGVTIDTARSAMDYKAIVTGMGTVFMMGVGEVDGGPLDVGALDAQIEKWVIGEYTQGPSTERNGYSGVRGSISGSMHFAPRENTRAPMMNVEVYQDDGRVIIIGVAQDQNRSGNVIIGQSAEPEVEREFYQSLQIGPKPVGGGGGFFF